MANGAESTKNYLYSVLAICTILTLISGVICYLISTKVSTAINPITTRVAAAEDKMNSHIVISDKYHATITEKNIFDLTVKEINKDIVEIKLSQQTVSEKLDGLINIMLQQNSLIPLQPGG